MMHDSMSEQMPCGAQQGAGAMWCTASEGQGPGAGSTHIYSAQGMRLLQH